MVMEYAAGLPPSSASLHIRVNVFVFYALMVCIEKFCLCVIVLVTVLMNSMISLLNIDHLCVVETVSSADSSCQKINLDLSGSNGVLLVFNPSLTVNVGQSRFGVLHVFI